MRNSEPPWEVWADESSSDTEPVQNGDPHHTPGCSELWTFLYPGSEHPAGLSPMAPLSPPPLSLGVAGSVAHCAREMARLGQAPISAILEAS